MNPFEALGLREEIVRSLQDLQFETPTPIQAQAIPFVLSGQRDLIAFAQTGTGKTAAFGLPLIHQVDETNPATQALILSPTRELCLQISRDLSEFSKYINGLEVIPIYGGVDAAGQLRALRDRAQIVVATPGRALDLINRKKLRIDSIQQMVLDEADEMLSMGFKDELDAILSHTPQDKQTLLFSATMPNEMMRIARQYMHDPEQISVGRRNAGADMVRHQYFLLKARDRYEVLKRVVDLNPSMYSIVFCRTRNETREIAQHLVQEGYSADALHGDLSQGQREVVMNRFRHKSVDILIATDVAARGLDVNDLTHVINYSLPDDPEVYVHRSGRTGRAGRSGVCISMVHGRDRGKLKRIEKTLKKDFDELKIPTGRDICQKQLFNYIDQMENVEVSPEVEPFLPEISAKLSWLSKDELIKRMVSLEFTHLLDKYKDARDLLPTGSEKDGQSNRRERKKAKSEKVEGYSTIFVAVGKKDRVTPKDIITLVNRAMPRASIKIGQIHISRNYTLFEIDQAFESDLVKALGKMKHKGAKLGAKVAVE